MFQNLFKVIKQHGFTRPLPKMKYSKKSAIVDLWVIFYDRTGIAVNPEP